MKTPRSIGDLVTSNVDPLLRKRAGLKGALIAQWAQIVGDELATHCLPVQVRWKKPSRNAITDETQEDPAVLVISASGIWALRVQHMTGEIIDRINVFFGYRAIDRIVIEQRMVARPTIGARTRRRSAPVNVSDAERRDIDGLVDRVSDPALRETLRQLGLAVKGDKRRKP